MERIREKDGVLFVNDSKATNPTATAPALAAFERIRWICGGQAKTDNLDECAPHFGHVRKAYTIGEAGELFASLLSPHMAVAECETLERAVGAGRGGGGGGRHGAAVAGLRVVRPVSGFRGARATSSVSWWRGYDQEHLGPDQGQGRADGPGPLRPLGHQRARPLVLGDRQGPAAAGHGADRDRPDRGRRRIARRRRSAIRAGTSISPSFIISGASSRGSRSACR